MARTPRNPDDQSSAPEQLTDEALAAQMEAERAKMRAEIRAEEREIAEAAAQEKLREELAARDSEAAARLQTAPTVPEVDAARLAPGNPMDDMITVIIHRPHGVTDSHAYFGFNNIEGQYAYDKPVKMPRAMVEHLRNSKGVEYRANEEGNPVPSYAFANSIVDA